MDFLAPLVLAGGSEGPTTEVSWAQSMSIIWKPDSHSVGWFSLSFESEKSSDVFGSGIERWPWLSDWLAPDCFAQNSDIDLGCSWSLVASTVWLFILMSAGRRPCSVAPYELNSSNLMKDVDRELDVEELVSSSGCSVGSLEFGLFCMFRQDRVRVCGDISKVLTLYTGPN